MNSNFPQYTVDYISGTLCLRTPQKKSLAILDEILSSINLKEGMNNKVALGAVHSLCPTCTDFERDRELLELRQAQACEIQRLRIRQIRGTLDGVPVEVQPPQ